MKIMINKEDIVDILLQIENGSIRAQEFIFHDGQHSVLFDACLYCRLCHFEYNQVDEFSCSSIILIRSLRTRRV